MDVHCFGAVFAAYKLHLAWDVVGSKISPLQQFFNVLFYGHFLFKHFAVCLLPPPIVKASVYPLASQKVCPDLCAKLNPRQEKHH